MRNFSLSQLTVVLCDKRVSACSVVFWESEREYVWRKLFRNLLAGSLNVVDNSGNLFGARMGFNFLFMAGNRNCCSQTICLCRRHNGMLKSLLGTENKKIKITTPRRRKAALIRFCYICLDFVMAFAWPKCCGRGRGWG